MVFDVYSNLLWQYVLALSDGEFLLICTVYRPAGCILQLVHVALFRTSTELTPPFVCKHNAGRAGEIDEYQIQGGLMCY
jgi:hypothetical protein